MSTSTYYVTLTGTTGVSPPQFKAIMLVNNDTNLITSFKEYNAVAGQDMELLGNVGDSGRYGANGPATNDVVINADGVSFGSLSNSWYIDDTTGRNNVVVAAINFWTCIHVNGNLNLTTLVNNVAPTTGVTRIGIYNYGWNTGTISQQNGWFMYKEGVFGTTYGNPDVLIETTTSSQPSISITDQLPSTNGVSHGCTLSLNNCTSVPSGNYLYAQIQTTSTPLHYIFVPGDNVSPVDVPTIVNGNANFSQAVQWSQFTTDGTIGGNHLSVHYGDICTLYIHNSAVSYPLDPTSGCLAVLNVSFSSDLAPPSITMNIDTVLPTGLTISFSNYETPVMYDAISIGFNNPPSQDDSSIAVNVGNPTNTYNFADFSTAIVPLANSVVPYTVGLWSNYGLVLVTTATFSFSVSASITPTTSATTTGVTVTLAGCNGLPAGYKLWVTNQLTQPLSWSGTLADGTHTLNWNNSDFPGYSSISAPYATGDNCILWIDNTSGTADPAYVRVNFTLVGNSISSPSISVVATPTSISVTYNNYTSNMLDYLSIDNGLPTNYSMYLNNLNITAPSGTSVTKNYSFTSSSSPSFDDNFQTTRLGVGVVFPGFVPGQSYDIAIISGGSSITDAKFHFNSASITVDSPTQGGANISFSGCGSIDISTYIVQIVPANGAVGAGTIYTWTAQPVSGALPTTLTPVLWSAFQDANQNPWNPANGDKCTMYLAPIAYQFDNTTAVGLLQTNSFAVSSQFTCSGSAPSTPTISVSYVGINGMYITYNNYTSENGDYIAIDGLSGAPSITLSAYQINTTSSITSFYSSKSFIPNFNPSTSGNYTIALYINRGSQRTSSLSLNIANVMLGQSHTSITTTGPGTLTLNGCSGIEGLGYQLWVKPATAGANVGYKYNGTFVISSDPQSLAGLTWSEFDYTTSMSKFSPGSSFQPVGGEHCIMYLSPVAKLIAAYTSTTFRIPGNPPPPPPAPCFRAGSLILCEQNDTEIYLPIETLKPGMRVKTSSHEFVPIDMIGYTLLQNPGHSERTQNRLYKCSTANYPELTEDLYITGCHSILVDDMTEAQKQSTLTQLKDIFVTKGKYRLMACIDTRAEPFADEADYQIWHIALENTEYYQNYGIWANGLLVETCSKRYLKELSGMTLVKN